MENSRLLGTKIEEEAISYLNLQGINIICHSFSYRQGEIDLIGIENKNTLVFFEVKYRKNANQGLAIEAVDLRKQKQISRTALYFLAKNPKYEDYFIRFDVIGFDGDKKITWIKNAFDYVR